MLGVATATADACWELQQQQLIQQLLLRYVIKHVDSVGLPTWL